MRSDCEREEKPPYSMPPAARKPNSRGNATPSRVMTTLGTPIFLNCLRSVSSPAENMMSMTPILARKDSPSIAEEVNTLCPGM